MKTDVITDQAGHLTLPKTGILGTVAKFKEVTKTTSFSAGRI